MANRKKVPVSKVSFARALRGATRTLIRDFGAGRKLSPGDRRELKRLGIGSPRAATRALATGRLPKNSPNRAKSLKAQG